MGSKREQMIPKLGAYSRLTFIKNLQSSIQELDQDTEYAYK